jgi:hypothetical protein
MLIVCGTGIPDTGRSVGVLPDSESNQRARKGKLYVSFQDGLVQSTSPLVFSASQATQ